MAIRHIKQIIQSHPSSDGNGVKVKRTHGFENAPFSPFLIIQSYTEQNNNLT
ncbi:hypothetical protein [uncultured Photobacterium sp.]|uniref:hypothetical protein n=1 Tax=uncultured Photobacterium sp. TaxID=173973 RepID=UPI002635647C|nr:hypothetical protein [uncultured Photobacterium sp.]